MPRRLLRNHTESYYHCVSRVVDRTRSLKEAEKRHFHHWMRRLERFCGVQVVTYCLMENHFHLLIRVPCRDSMPALTEGILRELLPLIYEKQELRDALQELDRVAAASTPRWMNEILARYSARRYSLSIFLKELKQRYTRWHNRRHQRTGTLWEERFRSVLVEPDETALMTIAAYIDLNPVRAGIVDDPVGYRWCGYAEAVVGNSIARQGLCSILAHTSFGTNRTIAWRNTGPRYRMLLFGQGERRDADPKTGSHERAGMSRDAVEAVLDRGGELSVTEIIRCRIRSLSAGGALGRPGFLQEVFDENRESFGAGRKSAGRRIQGSDWGGLQVLHCARKNWFGRGEVDLRQHPSDNQARPPALKKVTARFSTATLSR